MRKQADLLFQIVAASTLVIAALLMVGMVAAMKGFNGKEGTQLAEVIVKKIQAAVNQITYK